MALFTNNGKQNYTKIFEAVVNKTEDRIAERNKLLAAMDTKIAECDKKIEESSITLDTAVRNDSPEDYKAAKEEYSDAALSKELYTKRKQLYESSQLFTDAEREEMFRSVRKAQDGALESAIKKIAPLLKQISEIGNELDAIIAAGDDAVRALDKAETIFPERKKTSGYTYDSAVLRYQDERLLTYIKHTVETGWYPEIINNSFEPL